MITKPKVRGMFLGIAIGDALGMPVETMSLEQIAEKFGRVDHYICPDGHKWYDGREAGTWTDDTQLSLAVAESLIANRGINLDDIAQRHVQAMQESSLGWGGSTIESVKKMESGIPWSRSGQTGEAGRGCGNGVAMKVAPLGILLALQTGEEVLRTPAEFEVDIINISWMTHRTGMAIASALAQIFAVTYLAQIQPADLSRERFMHHLIIGTRRGEIFTTQSEPGDWLSGRLESLQKIDWGSLSTEKISDLFGKGTSYIYNSLPFSYAFFLRNPHSIETLYDVAGAGGDTDTNSSMIGALLGALHGEKIFPENLVRELWRVEEILDAAERFCRAFGIN